MCLNGGNICMNFVHMFKNNLKKHLFKKWSGADNMAKPITL